MQSFTAISASTSLAASLAPLLANDSTVMSNNSGTAFPTTNLQVGMACHRTDQQKVYILTSTGPSVWQMWIDLALTPVYTSGATFTGAVNLSGTNTVTGALNVSGTQTNTGAVNLSGTNNVTGALNLSGTTSVTGAVNLTGVTTVAAAGTLNVTGVATFEDGKIAVKGATSGTTTVKAAAVAGTGNATLPTGTSTLAAINVKQTFTAQQTPMNGNLTDAATVSWDGDTNGQVVRLAPTANRAMGAPTNIVQGNLYIIRLAPTGAFSVSWDSAFKFGAAGAPAQTATNAKVDYLSFIGGAANTLDFLGSRMDAV